MTKADFDKVITKFAENIHLAPGYSDALTEAVIDEWVKRQKGMKKDEINFDEKILELQS